MHAHGIAYDVRYVWDVPPLQGSRIGLGPIDPGRWPGLRYLAPLGLTCPHLELGVAQTLCRSKSAVLNMVNSTFCEHAAAAIKAHLVTQSLASSNSAVLGFETTERPQSFCETKL